MKQSDSITVFQVSLLIMTFSGFKNHVLLIPPLLQTAGRDGWMSTLIALVFILLWCFLLVFIHKSTKQEHLTFWFKKKVGTPMSFLFSSFICFVLFTIATFDLRETISWTRNIFLPTTPSWVLTILLSTLCFLTAASSLRTLSIVNTFLLFFIVTFGFFIATVNIPFKNYQLLQPFMENGPLPVLKGALYPATGMAELIMLLFLQHKIDGPIRYRYFFINAFILAGLTIGPLLGAITEFGPTLAAKQRYPAYEEWGLGQLGAYIEHLDYLSIYQWLSGVYIRISSVLLILMEVTGIQDERKRKWILLVLFMIVNILVLIPLTDMQFYHFMTFKLIPANFLILIGLSAIWGIIIFLHRLKETRTNS